MYENASERCHVQLPGRRLNVDSSSIKCGDSERRIYLSHHYYFNVTVHGIVT